MRWRWTRWWMTAASAACTLLGCTGGPPNPYPAEIVEAFVTACKANATESVCRCAIDHIQRRFSLDEFVAFEKRIAQTDVPKELVDATAECRGQ